MHSRSSSSPCRINIELDEPVGDSQVGAASTTAWALEKNNQKIPVKYLKHWVITLLIQNSKYKRLIINISALWHMGTYSTSELNQLQKE